MNKYLNLIILLNGLIWSKSSYGKLASGNFVDNLGKTLTAFASKNPYPWYKDFLNNIAIPNSQIFGNLTMYGELFAALVLTFVPLYLLLQPNSKLFPKKLINYKLAAGLLIGAFLNLTFWLASGWTSPSTDSLNLLMLGVQVIALAAVLKSSKK